MFSNLYLKHFFRVKKFLSLKYNSLKCTEHSFNNKSLLRHIIPFSKLKLEDSSDFAFKVTILIKSNIISFIFNIICSSFSLSILVLFNDDILLILLLFIVFLSFFWVSSLKSSRNFVKLFLIFSIKG